MIFLDAKKTERIFRSRKIYERGTLDRMLKSTIAIIFFCFCRTETLYLSFKKPVSSSSTHGQFYAKAVTDGDDRSIMAANCFHSLNGYQHGSFQQWLKIDLENEYRVTRVTIVNRVQAGCDCHLRLISAAIAIGSGGDIRNFNKCGESVTLAQVKFNTFFDVRCQQPMSGRYVTVWFPSGSAEPLNICEVRVYNEFEPDICGFDTKVYPVGFWDLSLDTLLQQTGATKPLNQIITLEKINFSAFHAFTVAFYIYPFHNSIGDIISIGDTDSLRLTQTFGRLYNSEVTVLYDDNQLTRAHVLMPDTWTFLTLTFNGTITLWRNGEIVIFCHTNLTPLDFNAHQLQIGSPSGQLFAEVAALQLYDRALNEAEIKLAMAQQPSFFTNKGALFEMLDPLEGIAGQILQKGVTRTRADCSQTCLRSLCLSLIHI
ncbi:uncharacterized protein LOC117116609 [Anneissia japonica]|uniref:uncharacterized protein LOC117116609 n=1 Tax=Anneissia japonica TaxID=1529436 RepID=UPI0014258632|nr:uncharacterized protein LOC117116609 [Anneissia japonica]